MKLLEAQVRRALAELREAGWAVGPPADVGAWRQAVRVEARRADLKIRTGEARDLTPGADGALYPWAATVAGYETLRDQMGGLALDAFGSILVSAGARRD